MNPEPSPTAAVGKPQLAESDSSNCAAGSCATLTRRAALGAGAVVAGAAGVAVLAVLAGCSKGLRGAAGGSAAGGGASAVPGTVLAKVSQVPVGNALSATMGGDPILISQPAAGTIVTFSAICTHQGCTVAPAGKEFHCPCHGSVYDAATGAVLRGPAPAPLTKIPTHVANGDVITGA